jgi:hypothetical protein
MVMKDNALDKLEKLLQDIADSNRAILKAVTKPENRSKRFWNAVITGAAVLGVLSAVDIILEWLKELKLFGG